MVLGADHASAEQTMQLSGGTARIIDSASFPVSKTVAAALVEVEPGAIRELHWHPTTDEWQYYIEGQGRMGVFASGGKARTFDVQAGDVGYVPFAMGHYVENTGTTTLRFLELFKSDRFADFSLNQWLALTPPALVGEGPPGGGRRLHRAPAKGEAGRLPAGVQARLRPARHP